jgi:flagellar FliJ protein
MSNHLPLNTLIDLAAKELDDSARRLGALQQQCVEIEKQLDGLFAYRTEYQNRFTNAAKSGIGGANWRNFQQFIDTLGHAVVRQQNTLDAALERLNAAKLDWQQKKQKLSSYETLASRARQRENVRVGRLEQRESDEHAAKLLRMRALPTHD